MKKFIIALSIILSLVFCVGEFYVYRTKDKKLSKKEAIDSTSSIDEESCNAVNDEKESNLKTEVENNKYEDEINKYDPMIMLVNKDYHIDQSFKPQNLVKPYIYFYHSITEEEKYMEYEAAKAIEKLVEGAEADGLILYGLSGYRSYETQQLVFDSNVAASGLDYAQKYVALPGQSEHQTGLAMDFATVNGFLEEGSVETQWLVDNAHLYGCIVRYPKGKEDITGINYEPWHVRYVGEEVAKEIYQKNITFEEYFGY